MRTTNRQQVDADAAYIGYMMDSFCSSPLSFRSEVELTELRGVRILPETKVVGNGTIRYQRAASQDQR